MYMTIMYYHIPFVEHRLTMAHLGTIPPNGINPPMTLGLEDTKMRTSPRSVTTSMVVGCFEKSDRSAEFKQMNVVNPNLTMKHRYVYQS